MLISNIWIHFEIPLLRSSQRRVEMELNYQPRCEHLQNETGLPKLYTFTAFCLTKGSEDVIARNLQTTISNRGILYQHTNSSIFIKGERKEFKLTAPLRVSSKREESAYILSFHSFLFNAKKRTEFSQIDPRNSKIHRHRSRTRDSPRDTYL